MLPNAIRQAVEASTTRKPQYITHSQGSSLSQPEVVAEGNRWFVVYKPPKWLVEPANVNESLQTRLPALQSVCRVSLESDTVLFPMRLSQDIAGLTLACTDRGMSAQFSRQLVSGQIDRHYRALCTFDENSNLQPESLPSHFITVDVKRPGLCLVNTIASKLRASTLHNLLSSRGLQLYDSEAIPFKLQLYRLVFPDPISPASGDRLSVEMGMPGEWEHLLDT